MKAEENVIFEIRIDRRVAFLPIDEEDAEVATWKTERHGSRGGGQVQSGLEPLMRGLGILPELSCGQSEIPHTFTKPLVAAEEVME